MSAFSFQIQKEPVTEKMREEINLELRTEMLKLQHTVEKVEPITEKMKEDISQKLDKLEQIIDRRMKDNNSDLVDEINSEMLKLQQTVDKVEPFTEKMKEEINQKLDKLKETINKGVEDNTGLVGEINLEIRRSIDKLKQTISKELEDKGNLILLNLFWFSVD